MSKKEELRVGDLCFVEDTVWNNYCLRSQKFDDFGKLPSQYKQPIISIGEGIYNGYAMLAYPFWWWKLEELYPQK